MLSRTNSHHGTQSSSLHTSHPWPRRIAAVSYCPLALEPIQTWQTFAVASKTPLVNPGKHWAPILCLALGAPTRQNHVGDRCWIPGGCSPVLQQATCRPKELPTVPGHSLRRSSIRPSFRERRQVVPPLRRKNRKRRQSPQSTNAIVYNA